MKDTNHKMQLILAMMLAIFGILLFITSFAVPPTGVIDNSVLVAGGEAFTFSGSLIGIDYSAKMRYHNISNQQYHDQQ